MRTMNILGIDPSLNNTGLAICSVNLDTFEIVQITELKLANTDPTTAKKQVRKNSDDLRRSQEICLALEEIINSYHIQIACAEVPTGTQSARGSISNGICVGILGALVLLKVKLFQVLPNEVKLLTVGDKKASKRDMFDWALSIDSICPGWIKTSRPNDWDRPVIKKEGVKTFYHKSNEHLADAVAAVHAGIKSEPFQQAASFMKL